MTSAINLTLPKADITRAFNTLKMCRLTNKRRKQILKRVGRAVHKKAQLNIRHQQTVNGQPFAKRQSKKKRKKMLMKLGRTLSETSSVNHVDVGYKNALVGQTAYRQQHGTPEQFTARRFKKSRRKTDPAPGTKASRQQARALRKAGYTVPKKRGKGEKTPSIGWITSHIDGAQAGVMIRYLRNKQTKSSWTIQGPPRPYLGLSEAEGQQLLADEILKVMNR